MKITDRTQTQATKPPEKPRATPPPQPVKTEKAEAPKSRTLGKNLDVQA